MAIFMLTRIQQGSAASAERIVVGGVYATLRAALAQADAEFVPQLDAEGNTVWPMWTMSGAQGVLVSSAGRDGKRFEIREEEVR